jgi:hypothetical protein
MAKPNSRQSFGEYCLRKLGKPVININVEASQVLDRIDEALQVYSEKHFDATEKEWIGYRLTSEDIIKGYITTPDDILVIDQILSMDGVFQSYNDDPDFGYRYQLVMGSFSPFASLDILSYYLNVSYINEINALINVDPTFEYTRHKNKLTIAQNTKEMKAGSIIGLHVMKIINPDENPYVWNDKWLKEYATALIKRQWGLNMKKHGEIALLGGITVNGQQIYDEALTDIASLEEELDTVYQEPINFFMG